jgi:hypothetical protein
MGDLYAAASSIVVWLGEKEHGSDGACDATARSANVTKGWHFIPEQEFGNL